MPCIDRIQRRPGRAWRTLALAAVCAAAGCAQKPPAPPPRPVPAAPAAAVPAPANPRPTNEAQTPPAAAIHPAPAARAPNATATPAPRAPRYVKLAAPATPRDAAELRLQFARRLVEAHPDTSYTRRAPDRLLAIPVLEVELNGDGSVRQITVLRRPSTGNEATALAIEAVHRSAPYGNVSRLPRPWKVVETFLFDDDLRFKPRTLDSN